MRCDLWTNVVEWINGWTQDNITHEARWAGTYRTDPYLRPVQGEALVLGRPDARKRDTLTDALLTRDEGMDTLPWSVFLILPEPDDLRSTSATDP